MFQQLFVVCLIAQNVNIAANLQSFYVIFPSAKISRVKRKLATANFAEIALKKELVKM